MGYLAPFRPTQLPRPPHLRPRLSSSQVRDPPHDAPHFNAGFVTFEHLKTYES
jgi:hypothetical protein